ncbi:MAG: hypothetical protein ACW99F_03845 [Candidatus Hodarchaeales archaeon]|jgi:hypothetical protein
MTEKLDKIIDILDDLESEINTVRNDLEDLMEKIDLIIKHLRAHE